VDAPNDDGPQRRQADSLGERDLGDGGWTAKALDIFEKRIDGALAAIDAQLASFRTDLNVLMGRPAPAAEDKARLFGIGIGAWTALLTAFGSLLGTAAVILRGGS
jgi:hypothetical protein